MEQQEPPSFCRKAAKFLINDLKGIARKEKLEVWQAMRPDDIWWLLKLEDAGILTRAQVREIARNEARRIRQQQ